MEKTIGPVVNPVAGARVGYLIAGQAFLDAFASVVLGSLLQGDSLPIALDRSVQFATLAIKASFGYDLPSREGVLLERVLSNLKAPLTSMTYEDW